MDRTCCERSSITFHNSISQQADFKNQSLKEGITNIELQKQDFNQQLKQIKEVKLRRQVFRWIVKTIEIYVFNKKVLIQF